MTTNVKQDKSSWEQAYQSGVWTSLLSDGERAHYSVVADFIQRRAKPGSLLDVGSGEGVILKYLNLDLIAQYTAVDLTQTALDRISPRRPQDKYICSSLEEFAPQDKWDVILFNEVLYYTHDPVAEMRRFENCLRPDGYFVISMHKKSSPLAYNNRCIRRVRAYFARAAYEIIDAVEISKLQVTARWQVFLVRPPVSSK
jgi:2-polyprenyl-3-methyl-5-hydroxy-6-metoxy-1,4-benzoquinol methylase